MRRYSSSHNRRTEDVRTVSVTRNGNNSPTIQHFILGGSLSGPSIRRQIGLRFGVGHGCLSHRLTKFNRIYRLNYLQFTSMTLVCQSPSSSDSLKLKSAYVAGSFIWSFRVSILMFRRDLLRSMQESPLDQTE